MAEENSKQRHTDFRSVFPEIPVGSEQYADAVRFFTAGWRFNRKEITTLKRGLDLSKKKIVRLLKNTPKNE